MTNEQWLKYYGSHPSEFNNYIRFTDTTIARQAVTIERLTEALQQIASSPEVGHPADLLKLLAQQALEEA